MSSRRSYSADGGVQRLQVKPPRRNHEATLTAEYKLADGFIVRAEFRRDWSSESFFPGPLGAGDLRGHQKTALIGGIWAIGNKTGTCNKESRMLTGGMVVLGLATFAAMVGFVAFCDRV